MVVDVSSIGEHITAAEISSICSIFGRNSDLWSHVGRKEAAMGGRVT